MITNNYTRKIGDVNGNGLQDIYFKGIIVSSRLYLNKRNWTFEDVTHQAGISTDCWITGVTMVDINGDGIIRDYVEDYRIAVTSHTIQAAF